MRLLVLSQIADWDFGPRVKAGGHEIVAWVRPTWARGERYSEGAQALRTTFRTIFSGPEPIRAIPPKFDTWTWLEREKIPRIPCPNVNAPKFIEYVKGLNIDLIVSSIFPQILKAAILRTPRLGAINCHPSLLPRYAGPQPEFWKVNAARFCRHTRSTGSLLGQSLTIWCQSDLRFRGLESKYSRDKSLQIERENMITKK